MHQSVEGLATKDLVALSADREGGGGNSAIFKLIFLPHVVLIKVYTV